MKYEHYAKVRDYYEVKDGKVAAETGIARATFTEWKKGTYEPKADKLQKIANYFDISMELFEQPIGKYGTFKPVLIERHETLSEDEKTLIEIARKNDLTKRMLAYAKFLMEEQ